MDLTNENLKREALEQLKAITQTIEANNKIQFPALRFICYGIFILFVPVIEYPTQMLTFGKDWGEYFFAYLAISHLVFYFFYFRSIPFLLQKLGYDFNELDGSHLLIKKSLSIYMPIVVTIAGLVVVLPIIGQIHLCYPIVYILFGILLNIYGHFVSRIVTQVSWYLIVIGFAYVYVSQYQNKDVWVLFNSILGLLFIYLGVMHRDRGAKN